MCNEFQVVSMLTAHLYISAHTLVIFFSLNELVQSGRNGFIFNDASELSEQLINWFYGYPGNVVIAAMKDEFLKNLKSFQMLRWRDNWNKIALPLLQ